MVEKCNNLVASWTMSSLIGLSYKDGAKCWHFSLGSGLSATNHVCRALYSFEKQANNVDWSDNQNRLPEWKKKH